MEQRSTLTDRVLSVAPSLWSGRLFFCKNKANAFTLWYGSMETLDISGPRNDRLNALIFAFDPSGYTLRQLGRKQLLSNLHEILNTVNSEPLILEDVTIAHRELKVRSLPTWLEMKRIASRLLFKIDMPSKNAELGKNTHNEVTYFSNVCIKPEHTNSSPEASSSCRSDNDPDIGTLLKDGNLKLTIIHVSVYKAPQISWANSASSFVLNSKLAALAKAEYAKAVNSTLGGAYATLQRAGWARLYAKRQLSLALASNDQELALRAKVYLQICKIIAILHPKHSRRITYEDETKGITTKTDTNVKASDAVEIPLERKLALKKQCEELMVQAQAYGDEAIIGLVRYAQHRIDTN